MYRWLEHTGELALAIDAPTAADVFADALAAYAELVAREGGGEPAQHEIALQSSDRATLLADFLCELVFLADTERFVPERIATLDLGEASLRAIVEGRRGDPSPLVKAVTYHGLEFEEQDDGCRAHVVLDV